MTDQERLAGYIDVWWSAIEDFIDLLAELPEEQWDTPTDLAGWDVRACAAHTAHLERVLAGYGEEHAELGDPPPAHVTSLMGHYTEIGVVNRREHSPADLLAELREVTARRREQLAADPPTDGRAHPEVIFGGVPWDWNTLLRNRPLDVWMHEQDVRRAVGRHGGLHTRAADHTIGYLMESFGYIVAKKAAAPAGTTAVLDVEGSVPVGVVVGDDGRGQRLERLPGTPDLVIAMDREAFVVLAGGRRAAPADAVTIEGDVELGRRIVDNLGTTP
ncbi:maleylpyruvate isomerase family mycothiol-dependent enzyme [Nocardioides sp. R-C-SC26]|uniref:maleylpyruvate isomerase family mycothiol-dependent enzyme n=1 Tax=Nocardioides sp. R-C-SC26 TaxID=2870414 RepID=UPI001E4EEAC6|nr:maleylpyruvate isomerase family mycothiol-dependent enzyme [Nocardioides sp. R-C-SC26]